MLKIYRQKKSDGNKANIFDRQKKILDTHTRKIKQWELRICRGKESLSETSVISV